MPNRMLRDWTNSDRMNQISVYAERFFVRLIMKVDDYGCFYADTRLLKANLFPLQLDSVREADLLRWMAECQKAGLIVIYESAGKKYVQILDFKQRLDKARSKFPLPNSNNFPEVVNGLPETANEFPAELEPEDELKKKRIYMSQVAGEKKESFSLPTTDHLQGFAPKKNNGVTPVKFDTPAQKDMEAYVVDIMCDPEKPPHWPQDKCINLAAKCFDYYTANGWKQGRGKQIYDWKAACRTFIRNEVEGVFHQPSPIFNQKTELVHNTSKAALNKLQVEVNYLYDRFREGSKNVTVISVDPLHFDEMQKAGLITFDENTTAGIRSLAVDHMVSKSIPITADNLKRYMKKFGILEAFRGFKKEFKTAIFN